MGTGTRKPQERNTTDQSLRAERQKTDTELAARQKGIKQEAVATLAEARERADTLLEGSRAREDRKLDADGASTQVTEGIRDEREEADATLTAERKQADDAAATERARRALALASLLAFEREDTDLRLELERARADAEVTSREDILAMVSHDLRTLLGAIALRGQMLTALAGTDQPIAKVAPQAASIQRICARMNRLIGDLMDVASIEAGKLSVEPRLHDAALLVRDALDAFQPAASSQGIALTCEIAPGIPRFVFDHERILQVLTNLVGNAFKFTARGGRVVVGLAPRGDDVCFSVRDTGEGIPADRLDKIFDRFFQTNRHDRRGLGLGLYIARSIVEAHGGTISVESTVGQGSTFTVTLPREEAPPTGFPQVPPAR